MKTKIKHFFEVTVFEYPLTTAFFFLALGYGTSALVKALW